LFAKDEKVLKMCEIWNINFDTFKIVQITFLPQEFDGDILFELPPLYAIANMIEQMQGMDRKHGVHL
jgi:hypothetical protein